MVKLSDEAIKKIYVKNQTVSKIYLGNSLVYEKKEDDANESN